MKRRAGALRLAVLTLLAFEMPSAASPSFDKIAQRMSTPFPGYIRHCGYPIVYKYNSHISYAKIDPRLGPIITLDPRLAHPSEAGHRRFLIAHECAHLRLTHTSKRGLRLRRRAGGVEDQELSADCWAAELLVAAGMANDVRVMVDRLYRKGLYSPGSGYPSGVQRSAVLYHCLKIAASGNNSDKQKTNSRRLIREAGPVPPK